MPVSTDSAPRPLPCPAQRYSISLCQAAAAVFGAPDERLGEVPIAIVLAKDGEQLSEEQLRSFLDGRLAKFKIPQRIIFADAPLPKLGTGKIDRPALKAQYAR